MSIVWSKQVKGEWQDVGVDEESHRRISNFHSLPDSVKEEFGFVKFTDVPPTEQLTGMAVRIRDEATRTFRYEVDGADWTTAIDPVAAGKKRGFELGEECKTHIAAGLQSAGVERPVDEVLNENSRKFNLLAAKKSEGALTDLEALQYYLIKSVEETFIEAAEAERDRLVGLATGGNITEAPNWPAFSDANLAEVQTLVGVRLGLITTVPAGYAAAVAAVQAS